MKSADQITNLEFETRAIHHANSNSENGAVVPPIYMTSTFAFDSIEDVNLVVSGERPGFVYGREFNPTQTLLEHRLATWKVQKPPSRLHPAWVRSARFFCRFSRPAMK